MGRIYVLGLWLLAGLVACGETSRNKKSADGTSVGGTGGEGGTVFIDSGSTSGPTVTSGTGGASTVATSTIGAGAATTTFGAGGDAGGAGEAGAPGTGGEGTGGASGTTTGGTSLCDCDADPILVCGVDGNTYDIACGEDCVPVEVDCDGACPCEPCHCVGTFNADVCDITMENDYRCNTADLDYDLAEEYGCYVGGTDLEGSFGPVAICCPLGHSADELCLDR